MQQIRFLSLIVHVPARAPGRKGGRLSKPKTAETIRFRLTIHYILYPIPYFLRFLFSRSLFRVSSDGPDRGSRTPVPGP